jgi:hypothetical protein
MARKLPFASTTALGLVMAAGAAAQSSLSAPPSGVSSPPSGLSTPGLPSLSGPAEPTISSPGLPGISTATQPTMSASPLDSLFPLPPFLDDGAATSSSTGAFAPDDFTLATNPSRSPFDDGPIFIGQRSGSFLGSSTVLSGGLLDSLLDTSGLFEDMLAAPSVGIAAGAAFGGGGAVFSEFCRPEDFTCR